MPTCRNSVLLAIVGAFCGPRGGAWRGGGGLGVIQLSAYGVPGVVVTLLAAVLTCRNSVSHSAGLFWLGVGGEGGGAQIPAYGVPGAAEATTARGGNNSFCGVHVVICRN